jgi:fumarate hydratase class I
MIKLKTPLAESAVRKLSCGDRVEISGVIYTARDAAHKWLTEENPGELAKKLSCGVVYHCGPVMAKDARGWRVVSAGPTTSIREEPYEADVIGKYNVRAVIGKGGMGEKTKKALEKHGCVYLSAVGGAAAVLADAIKGVTGVYKLEEFGTPEAVWELAVEGFPAVVSMDSHGRSLHEGIYRRSQIILEKLFEVLNNGLEG